MNGEVLAVLGVLVILLGVIVSISLHEVGHLVPAKRFGVRCTQYMIGFGPTLWSRRVGDTEYGVKAIPLGGYVRMLGMFPPRPAHAAAGQAHGRWSALVEQARRDSYQEVGAEDADRLFYQRPVWQRLIIMLGGPCMNLLLGTIMIAVVVCGFGLPGPSTRLSAVQECVLPMGEPDRACRPSDERAPGAVAGLRPGDEVRSINGVEVGSWDVVKRVIRSSGGREIPLVVRRGDQTLTLHVTPIVTERERKDAQGEVVRSADGAAATEKVGYLGVIPGQRPTPQSVTVVPGMVADSLEQIAGVVVKIPQKMLGVVGAVFGGGERDPESPVSIVGIGRFAGEIGAEKGTVAEPFSLRAKFAFWAGLLAALNLALFVFNLIPLLPLDGGHVAGAVWEAVRRAVARLRRRPDPGPVDVARALPLAYGVASVLIGMSVLLMYADIVNPVRVAG